MPVVSELVDPTPERKRRGVELVPQAIADDDGNPSQPYRAIDILAALYKRGAINAELRDAGEDFRSEFRRAGLDGLRAADMSRPPGGQAAALELFSSDGAKRRVWQAIAVLGGISHLPGACAWDVLGWEVGLKRWGLFHGMALSEARGVLRVTLVVLAQHYGKIRPSVRP